MGKKNPRKTDAKIARVQLRRLRNRPSGLLADLENEPFEARRERVEAAMNESGVSNWSDITTATTATVLIDKGEKELILQPKRLSSKAGESNWDISDEATPSKISALKERNQSVEEEMPQEKPSGETPHPGIAVVQKQLERLIEGDKNVKKCEKMLADFAANMEKKKIEKAERKKEKLARKAQRIQQKEQRRATKGQRAEERRIETEEIRAPPDLNVPESEKTYVIVKPRRKRKSEETEEYLEVSSPQQKAHSQVSDAEETAPPIEGSSALKKAHTSVNEETITIGVKRVDDSQVVEETNTIEVSNAEETAVLSSDATFTMPAIPDLGGDSVDPRYCETFDPTRDEAPPSVRLSRKSVNMQKVLYSLNSSDISQLTPLRKSTPQRKTKEVLPEDSSSEKEKTKEVLPEDCFSEEEKTKEVLPEDSSEVRKRGRPRKRLRKTKEVLPEDSSSGEEKTKEVLPEDSSAEEEQTKEIQSENVSFHAPMPAERSLADTSHDEPLERPGEDVSVTENRRKNRKTSEKTQETTEEIIKPRRKSPSKRRSSIRWNKENEVRVFRKESFEEATHSLAKKNKEKRRSVVSRDKIRSKLQPGSPYRRRVIDGVITPKPPTPDVRRSKRVRFRPGEGPGVGKKLSEKQIRNGDFGFLKEGDLWEVCAATKLQQKNGQNFLTKGFSRRRYRKGSGEIMDEIYAKDKLGWEEGSTVSKHTVVPIICKDREIKDMNISGSCDWNFWLNPYCKTVYDDTLCDGLSPGHMVTKTIMKSKSFESGIWLLSHSGSVEFGAKHPTSLLQLEVVTNSIFLFMADKVVQVNEEEDAIVPPGNSYRICPGRGSTKITEIEWILFHNQPMWEKETDRSNLSGSFQLAK